MLASFNVYYPQSLKVRDANVYSNKHVRTDARTLLCVSFCIIITTIQAEAITFSVLVYLIFLTDVYVYFTCSWYEVALLVDLVAPLLQHEKYERTIGYVKAVTTTNAAKCNTGLSIFAFHHWLQRDRFHKNSIGIILLNMSSLFNVETIMSQR